MIHIKPNIIKDFYFANRAKLNTVQVLCAENATTGAAIYLTIELGLPQLSVDIDGCTELEDLSTVPDLEKDYEKLLDTYINTEPTSSPPAEYTSDDLDDLTPRKEFSDEDAPDPDACYPEDDEVYDATVFLIETITGASFADLEIESDAVDAIAEVVVDMINGYLSQS